jgi:hypothetical protein
VAGLNNLSRGFKLPPLGVSTSAAWSSSHDVSVGPSYPPTWRIRFICPRFCQRIKGSFLPRLHHLFSPLHKPSSNVRHPSVPYKARCNLPILAWIIPTSKFSEIPHRRKSMYQSGLLRCPVRMIGHSVATPEILLQNIIECRKRPWTFSAVQQYLALLGILLKVNLLLPIP